MANFNFSNVVLGGRLTADPEVKMTQTGTPVCQFCVAISRKDGADFINCVAFRSTAQFIGNYFHKGSAICVTGALQTRRYDKDGQKHIVTEVMVKDATFVDGKKDGEPQTEPTPNYETIPEDADLPF